MISPAEAYELKTGSASYFISKVKSRFDWMAVCTFIVTSWPSRIPPDQGTRLPGCKPFMWQILANPTSSWFSWNFNHAVNFLELGNGIFFPPDLLCSCYSQIFGAWRIEIVYRGRTHFVVVFLYFAQRHPQDLQSSKPVKEVTVVEILYQKAFGKRPQSPTKIKPPKTAYNFSGLLYNTGLASWI